MTTLQVQSTYESLKIGRVSIRDEYAAAWNIQGMSYAGTLSQYLPPVPTSTRPNVIHHDFALRAYDARPETVSLEEVISDMEQDAEVAEMMRAVRREAASRIAQEHPITLARLRLQAGLSQKQLAKKLGTSQPYIANLENGRTDPGTDAIANLAAQLDVDPSEVFSAILNQRQRGVGNV